MEFAELAVSISESSGLWRCTAALKLAAEYDALSVGDGFSVVLGGVTYQFIVDQKSRTRPGVGQIQYVLTGVSPVAAYDAPRAERLTKTWDQDITANAVVDEVLEQAVTWDLIDWTIPAGRLAFTDAVPLDIARAVVSAAGGLILSNPDGTVVVQPQFPVAVPDWSTAIPDQIFTESDDLTRLSEQRSARDTFNTLTISDETGTQQASALAIEIDDRPAGLNGGKTTFEPGDEVAMLVYSDDDLTIVDRLATVGTVTVLTDQTFQRVEDVAFNQSSTAQLAKPADSVDAVEWLGADLGLLTLQADDRTVTAAASGFSVARVTYTVTAQAFKITLPATVAGKTTFPVNVLVEAD